MITAICGTEPQIGTEPRYCGTVTTIQKMYGSYIQRPRSQLVGRSCCSSPCRQSARWTEKTRRSLSGL